MIASNGTRRYRGSGFRIMVVFAIGGLALTAVACGEGSGAGDPGSTTPPAASTDGGGSQPTNTPPAGGVESAVAPDAPQKQFPPQDHLNKIVTAYGVASEHPELLTGLPCYCPCNLYGHGGVIDCHRSQHAAMCNICLDEAIEVSQLYEAQLLRGETDPATAQAAVKDRYRRALMAQKAQEFPNTSTPQGQAFLQACSDCHQPSSPAMHTAMDWDGSLARMEQYANERGSMPATQSWELASSYVKSVSGQVPAATVAQLRQSLQTTVEHLKAAEGEAAYYPSVRDPVLDPAWAERMAAAYNTARDLPSELLAATPTSCKPCQDAGQGDLLACLNSWQAITCETAIEEVERLAAENGQR